MPDLYIGRTIPVKPKCTRGDVYVDNPLVHDVYMAGGARKKSGRIAKVHYEPCKLRAWRDERGLSQHELSDQIGAYLKVHGIKAGHSYSMIGRIERGVEPYNQAILQAASHILKVDVRKLLFVAPGTEEDCDNITEIVKEVIKRRDR